MELLSIYFSLAGGMHCTNTPPPKMTIQTKGIDDEKTQKRARAHTHTYHEICAIFRHTNRHHHRIHRRRRQQQQQQRPQ